MGVCQKESRAFSQDINQAQRHAGKSEMLLEKRSDLTATTVELSLLPSHHTMQGKKDIIALQSATQQTEKKTGNPTNKILGKVELVVMSLIVNGLQRTKSVWLTSKLADMQESVGQRVRTHLKNGHSLKPYITIDVQYAKNISHLLKTILCHSRKVARTTSQTFSHYAETVTVRSGLSFNTYKNPELIERKEQ